MVDIHCDVYLVTFKSESASVNIPLVNDNVPECDETFTARIIVGDGFRLGEIPSTNIIIKDDGKGPIGV